MNQVYSKELRADTAALLIPLIAGATALVALLAAVVVVDFAASWHLWLAVVLAMSSGLFGWQALKKNQRIVGTLVFTAVHLFILTLIIHKNWAPGSLLPYLFAVLIIASSMFVQPNFGFVVWGAATLLTAIGISQHTEGIGQLLRQLSGPTIVNLFVAGAAYFSAMEWQVAVESVSALHLKAQRRRDELFAIQEELRLANAKLHSTNEELDKARRTAVAERDLRTRFMYQVSHELRTPINTIVNFAHILGQGELGDVSERQVDYLGRIEKSGWHSMSVLNDLLDLAQMNAGEFRLKLELVDLHSVCDEAMASVRSLLHNPEIALVHDYPDVWPQVLVDPKRFQQALLNLLGNAAKYTDEGHIALRVRAYEQSATFAVEDTGVGIPAAHHEAVFQEFRQLHETTTRRRIGTGLGLPISRHLIERHGGTLTLHSEPGKGSTFTISLPLAKTIQANGRPHTPAVAQERPF
ncbi:sensor histidine kinase [Candidatus Leptofilum sp.]|uniref:sensor histidine kinase n=1 Tax=Candidatus Leptofilum sp. TaxID=3241576 RepID=UPI003B5AE916